MIECVPSKFEDDIKWRNAADTPEGRDEVETTSLISGAMVHQGNPHYNIDCGVKGFSAALLRRPWDSQWMRGCT